VLTLLLAAPGDKSVDKEPLDIGMMECQLITVSLKIAVNHVIQNSIRLTPPDSQDYLNLPNRK
jgi:hypothetical protein